MGHQNSLCTTEEQSKDIADSLNAKTKIHIRAEHFLSMTLTKTSFDLIQRLMTSYMNAYNNKLSVNEDGPMLSVHNLTGYEVLLDGIKDLEMKDQSELPILLQHGNSIPMAIPTERLSTTHLPAIADHNSRKQQELSIQLKMNNTNTQVDMNYASKRVYQLSPSVIPDWPIELLCDSHVYNNSRRLVLSSIVKVSLYILVCNSFQLYSSQGLQSDCFASDDLGC